MSIESKHTQKQTQPIVIPVFLVTMTLAIITLGGLAVLSLDHKVYGMTDIQRFDYGKKLIMNSVNGLSWYIDFLGTDGYRIHSVAFQNGMIAAMDDKFSLSLPYYDFDQKLMVNLPGKIVHMDINLYKPIE